jgi:hypothetical protein
VGGGGDIAPTGGRSTVAAVLDAPGAIPHSSAESEGTAGCDAAAGAVARTFGTAAGFDPGSEAADGGAFVAGGGPGLAPLARTRIAAPSNVTSTVPSRSVR